METKINKRPIKINGYSQVIANAKRAAKREEALTRQARYDALTREEKIERAQCQRGESRRELLRLGLDIDIQRRVK